MKSITGIIQQAVDPQVFHCETHGDFEGFIVKVRDREITPACPQCAEIEKETERKKAEQEQRKNALRRALDAAHIPPRFENRTFDNYRADSDEQKRVLSICQRYVANFQGRLSTGGGLILCGEPGTGKTHLAAAMVNQLIIDGYSALFTTTMRAIRRFKETYDKDSQTTEREVLKALIRPDLLVLDEVGVQFGTETEKLILFELINSRYEYMKPTVIVSNLSHDNLAAFLGGRIMDRLTEGGNVVLAFDWESYRSKAHNDQALQKEAVA